MKDETVINIVLFLALIVGAIAYWDISQKIPSCPEDAVLVPYGEYDGRHWTEYECGPSYGDIKELAND